MNDCVFTGCKEFLVKTFFGIDELMISPSSPSLTELFVEPFLFTKDMASHNSKK